MFKLRTLPVLFILIALLTGIPLSSGVSLAETQAESRDPYMIGANDVLNIFVWKEPDLTQDVVVTPDGRISFPLIGEVVAQGRTVGELRKIFTEKLSKYVEDPEITVIVKQSYSRFIYVIGNVKKVGPLRLEQDMTVLQAISKAGGFAEWAKTKKILIVRREGKKEVQFRFNYNEFTDGKNVKQNIVLKPNDTVVVP